MTELEVLEKELQEAEDRLGLMTPILKGVLTDYGFENAVKAQQVFGGHGYYWRDMEWFPYKLYKIENEIEENE